MTIGLASNQNSPDVTVNQMVDGYLAKDIAGTGTVTLTDNEATYSVIKLTGQLTGNRTIEMSDTANVIWFHDTTTDDASPISYTITIQPTSGSGFTVGAGNRGDIFACYLDGAGNAVRLTAYL